MKTRKAKYMENVNFRENKRAVPRVVSIAGGVMMTKIRTLNFQAKGERNDKKMSSTANRM